MGGDTCATVFVAGPRTELGMAPVAVPSERRATIVQRSEAEDAHCIVKPAVGRQHRAVEDGVGLAIHSADVRAGLLHHLTGKT